MTESSKYWFPAKRYGWGWGLPGAWQGWLVLAVYATALVAWGAAFPPAAGNGAFLVGAGVATIALLLICWLKGEPPRWRRGR